MSRDVPTPPSLPEARRVAREMHDRYRHINVNDPDAVAEAYSALHTTLGQVLDAIDYREAS